MEHEIEHVRRIELEFENIDQTRSDTRMSHSDLGQKVNSK